MEISWNFVSPKKWEPWITYNRKVFVLLHFCDVDLFLRFQVWQ